MDLDHAYIIEIPALKRWAISNLVSVEPRFMILSAVTGFGKFAIFLLVLTLQCLRRFCASGNSPALKRWDLNDVTTNESRQGRQKP